MKNLSFSHALDLIKEGHKVCRQGWNGKDMYIYMVHGSKFNVEAGRTLANHIPIGEEVEYHPHIDMKTAQGYHIPWLASQADLFANDWMILK